MDVATLCGSSSIDSNPDFKNAWLGLALLSNTMLIVAGPTLPGSAKDKRSRDREMASCWTTEENCCIHCKDADVQQGFGPRTFILCACCQDRGSHVECEERSTCMPCSTCLSQSGLILKHHELSFHGLCELGPIEPASTALNVLFRCEDLA